MELRQINTFIHAAQYQSFTKAALALGYTQSAVTVQIRLLEEELETKLFDRIGKQIRLTEKGEEFLGYAYEVLNLANHAKLAMKEEEELTGSLHIGALDSICFSKLPPIIQFFRQLHPRVHITVSAGSLPELSRMMEHSEVDLIYVIDEPLYNSSWYKAMEIPEPIVFVASPDIDFGPRGSISLEELIKKPFFLTEKGANYRMILDKYLAAKNLAVTPAFETRSPALILKVLRENTGVAFLPYFCIENDLEERRLKVIHVTDIKSFLYLQVFCHKMKRRTREMEAFIRLAKAF